jgi:hypothetical protein
MPQKKDPKLAKAGVSGYNKPKRTPNHPTKSHVVVAKEGDKTKTIRFGQQGVSGAGKNPKTDKEKARRKSFKARHAKNISKGKMSAAYWANKVKWLERRCESRVQKVHPAQRTSNKQLKQQKGVNDNALRQR